MFRGSFFARSFLLFFNRESINGVFDRFDWLYSYAKRFFSWSRWVVVGVPKYSIHSHSSLVMYGLIPPSIRIRIHHVVPSLPSSTRRNGSSSRCCGDERWPCYDDDNGVFVETTTSSSSSCSWIASTSSPAECCNCNICLFLAVRRSSNLERETNSSNRGLASL